MVTLDIRVNCRHTRYNPPKRRMTLETTLFSPTSFSEGAPRFGDSARLVAEFVRIPGLVNTHRKSHDFRYKFRDTLSKDGRQLVLVSGRDHVGPAFI